MLTIYQVSASAASCLMAFFALYAVLGKNANASNEAKLWTLKGEHIPYLPTEQLDRMFFPVMGEYAGIQLPPESKNNSDDLEKESRMCVLKKWERKYVFEAILDIINNRRKIQIITDKKREVQAAIYAAVPQKEWSGIYSISAGECTLSEADILITDHIEYQNSIHYRKMTWDEVLEHGSALYEMRKIDAFGENLDDSVNQAIMYILDCSTSNQIIREIRAKCLRGDIENAIEFQEKLRNHLNKLPVSSDKCRRFIEVVFLAYENTDGLSSDQDAVILGIPYDMTGILSFIREKCKKKSDLKRMIKVVAELRTEFTGYSSSPMQNKLSEMKELHYWLQDINS